MNHDDRFGTFVYGGSFDPCHQGHLWIVKFLTQLTTKIIIVPSYQAATYTVTPQHSSHAASIPPAKTHWLSFSTRCNLLNAALLEHQLTQVAAVNKVEQQLTQHSPLIHTYGTLMHLRAHLSLQPNSQLWWVMGQDQLTYFHRWHHAHHLITTFNLCVFQRPQTTTHPTKAASTCSFHTLTTDLHHLLSRLAETTQQPSFQLHLTTTSPTFDRYHLKLMPSQSPPDSQIILIKARPPSISSTDIRRHLAQLHHHNDFNQLTSYLRSQLGSAVWEYFQNHRPTNN